MTDKIQNAIDIIKQEENDGISDERLNRNKYEIMNRLNKGIIEGDETKSNSSAKTYRFPTRIAYVAAIILITLVFVVSIMFFSRSNGQNVQVSSNDNNTETSEKMLSKNLDVTESSITGEDFKNISYLFYDENSSESNYDEDIEIDSYLDLVLNDYERTFYFSSLEIE